MPCALRKGHRLRKRGCANNSGRTPPRSSTAISLRPHTARARTRPSGSCSPTSRRTPRSRIASPCCAPRAALLAEISDPLAWWKARLARSIGLSGAHASWEVRLARYVLGEGSDDDIADDATDGSRPCEAPYYFGVRAAAESRTRDAAAWYRVALECRNPGQPEFVWAYPAAAQLEQDPSLSAKLLQAAR